MFRFESFGSGSSGNTYYIKTDAGSILIDAGVGIRKLQKSFHEYGISLASINAILVTHKHVDHVRCLGLLNQKHRMPVYLTQTTLEGIKENPVITKKPLAETVTFVESEKTFSLLDMQITPFEVPHDSMGNVGYLIRHNDTRFCLVTDCGKWTNLIDSYVAQATHLVLESNYDPHMLETGPYPVYLQNRIRGGLGHLANGIAAQVIKEHKGHLNNIWLCHLSEKNNRPDIALKCAQQAVDEHDKVVVEALDRTLPSKLFKLEAEYDIFGQILR